MQIANTLWEWEEVTEYWEESTGTYFVILTSSPNITSWQSSGEQTKLKVDKLLEIYDECFLIFSNHGVKNL